MLKGSDLNKEEIVGKEQMVIANYFKAKGFKHGLLKLAEECNELSQAAIKWVNNKEDPDHVLEEMAHVMIFLSGVLYNWDKSDRLLLFNNAISERVHRLILKTMPKKKYPARIALGHILDFQEEFDAPDILAKHPTIKVIHDEVYSYLTPEQYEAQLMSANIKWMCPILNWVGEFDDEYYESDEDL